MIEGQDRMQGANTPADSSARDVGQMCMGNLHTGARSSSVTNRMGTLKERRPHVSSRAWQASTPHPIPSVAARAASSGRVQSRKQLLPPKMAGGWHIVTGNRVIDWRG